MKYFSLLLFGLISLRALGQETLATVTARGNSTSGDVVVNSYQIGKGAGNLGTNLVFGNNSLLGNPGGVNLAIGNNCLTSLTTSAVENLAIGNEALRFLTSGTENTVLGTYNMRAATTASGNTIVGNFSAFHIESGNDNTAVGKNAMEGVFTGSYNTGIGKSALSSNNIGNYNTALGWGAGWYATGNYNTVVGARVKGSLGMSNTVIIGDGAENDNSIRFFSPANGYVGLGTIDPKAKLEVHGPVVLGSDFGNLDKRGCNLDYLTGSAKMVIGWNRTGGDGEADFISNQGGGGSGGFAFYNHDNTNSESQLVRIWGNGNIGIGTTESIGFKLDVNGTGRFSSSLTIGTTAIGTDKLAVAGSIHATAVKVDPETWYDHVFYKNYSLPSLKSVEAYIESNKHLPDVPSENQVKKEGIEVGEMTGILLKKIEELTLYMIEKDKQLEKANKQIEVLAEKVSALEGKK